MTADVLTLRTRIDDIDAEIIALILERTEHARAIQADRLAEGGVRRDLAREAVVYARHRAGLGPVLGAGLAALLLSATSGRFDVP